MTQPIAAPAWQPPAPKPPLTAREKAGARLAGALGFVLLSLGWALFALPIAILAFGAFFALIFATIQRASGDDGPIGFLEGWDVGVWILPLILASVVGILLIVASLFVSRAILRSHGVNKPWAITFAGAAISIAASWVVSGLLTLPLQFAGIFSGNDPNGPGTVIVGVLTAIASIVSTAVIGFMAWWWMAHAMRPAVRAN